MSAMSASMSAPKSASVSASVSGTHALVLAAPRGALLPDHLEAAASAVKGGGAWRTLAEGRAAELVVAPADDALDAVRAALADAPVDANLVPLGVRGTRLFVADMDSTMIEQECIDELADRMGLKPRVAEITERAMRGELDFEAALTTRVAMLEGLDEAVLEEVWRTRITLSPGAKTLMATLRARGVHAALVSGGFTGFTSRVAAVLGFDEHRANRLEIESGRLTGRVVPPILGREAKEERLRGLAKELGLPLAQTLAIGDGANDLAMVGAAGLGVAYRAKPSVAAAADAAIHHTGLEGVLYLLGVGEAEFVS